ncbi:MAG: NADP-dependent oxidoreductase [Bdellovibrio sp.]
MKAARIHSFGSSEKIEIEDTSQPKAKNGEVLVKIHDAGVNPVDWKIREGYRRSNAQFPLTLGQDFSGEIVEVGTDVSDFKKGDRVFGFTSGSYSEFSCTSPAKIAHMPKSMDFETAASLPTPGLTAKQMIIDKAHVSSGQKVLVHGAAGGVGSLIVQLALWKKARVFATASSDDISYLKKLNVETVVDYKKDRFEELLKDMDIVIDLVGGDTLSRSYQIMKKGGFALSSVGSFKEEEAKSHGILGDNFMMSQNSTDLQELARLFEQGVLKVRVGEVLPLKDARKAQDLNKNGHTHGKVVLRMQ